jgi:hypothetical protein
MTRLEQLRFEMAEAEIEKLRNMVVDLECQLETADAPADAPWWPSGRDRNDDEVCAGDHSGDYLTMHHSLITMSQPGNRNQVIPLVKLIREVYRRGPYVVGESNTIGLKDAKEMADQIVANFRLG